MNATTQFWRDPALPYAESRRACHSRACYKPHSHPTFSIGAVDRGCSLFTGASESPVLLRAGTLVFVPAARVHACNPVPDSAWSYQMLHLDAQWLQAVRQEYAMAEARRDDDEPARVVAAPAIYAKFCRLNAGLFSDADPQDKEAALIEFIGDCDREQSAQWAQWADIDTPPRSPGLSKRLAPALELLRGEPTANAPLERLARLVGMSRYQLIRAFRSATGFTPHAWQLNQRVNLARERMRAGDGIADVAHDLGFADQAHFQRVFKAHAGVTPGCFRA
ncbi:AraC family transcriptional regulator [Xylophilus sp. GW821-FHT01B05]